jgi:predicted MFS family arabinose efflux permease
MAADRFGSVKVVAGGVALYALGLYGMAHVATPAGFILTAGVCIGIALSGTAFGVIYSAVSRLAAPERRAWAMGMAGAIGGLGQFVMVPAAQELIGALGWKASLLVLAVVMAAILPLVLPLKDRPAGAPSSGSEEAQDQALTEAVREAFSHPGFWLLNLGFLACGFQLAFIATHLPAYLIDKGMSPSDGVGALATIALTNIIGIYACGVLGERYRQKYLLSGLYLARTSTMALFVLLPLSTWSVYLFAAAMGLLWLGAVPLTNGLLSRVFGVRYLSTLFGFVFFGHQLGSFLGVWLGGYVFDATRSYGPIWLGAMALGVLSAALHWPINDRQVLRVTPTMGRA